MKRAACWLVCVTVLLVQACGSSEPAHEVSLGASEWLTQVQSAHTRADAALAQGDRDGAIAQWQRALELPAPAEVTRDHLRVVQQDLWFRSARAALARDPQHALQQAERGLALGRHDDLFTSNLLVARGRALQALGRDTEAASSYHEALALDERLLQAALRKGQAGGP